MENKYLVEYFKRNVEGKYDYRIQSHNDNSISVVFQPKNEDEWKEIKIDCEILWYIKNFKIEIDEKFHIIHATQSDSLFDTFVKLFGPRIPNKKKYIKTLLISLFVCMLFSAGGAVLLKLLGSFTMEIQTTVFIGLGILAIVFFLCFVVISLIFLNKESRKSWLNLMVNSTLFDIIFIVLIQHLNSPIIFQDTNLANAIVNVLLVILYAIFLSLLLVYGSYIIRKNIIKENENRTHYFYLRNKTLANHLDELKDYSSKNKIDLSNLILSNDATNDIVGHLNLKADEDNSNMISPLLFIFISLFLCYYFFGILAPLTIASRIVLLCFILFRIATATYNGVKKDKLVIVFASYHLEKIFEKIKN